MRHPGQRALRRAVSFLLPMCAAIVIAGCSNSGRFGGPSWNLTGGKGAAPLPEQPIHRQPQAVGLPAPDRQPPIYRGGRDPVSGRAPGWGTPQHGLETRQLPPPQQSQPHSLPPAAQPPAYLPPANKPSPRGQQGASAGKLVDVRPGQSLAMIAGEHQVSIASLMQANGLRDPYVIPGQQLVIPAR
jgi:hypothetical protein